MSTQQLDTPADEERRNQYLLSLGSRVRGLRSQRGLTRKAVAQAATRLLVAESRTGFPVDASGSTYEPEVVRKAVQRAREQVMLQGSGRKR